MSSTQRLRGGRIVAAARALADEFGLPFVALDNAERDDKAFFSLPTTLTRQGRLLPYAIEGGHSNNFALTKSLMYGNPRAWHRLCDLLATIMGEYMKAQIEAGAQAIQIFDSWVGALNSADYREFVMPHTKKIFAAIESHTSHFRK